jgi:hypothetical protein
MAAECMVSRTVNQPSGHRVEVDVENDPIEIALLVDRFRVVATLPQSPSAFLPSIESLTEPTLKILKPSRDGDRSAPNGEVIVV